MGAPCTRDSRKCSVYFPHELLEELKRESERLDRPIAWLVQQAWRLARDEMKQLPSAPHDGLTGTDD
jgi:uncharacterized small protein (TIGR04563 family)